ncbi:Os09g0489800, partial [Oryza sativa Japonica Group]
CQSLRASRVRVNPIQANPWRGECIVAYLDDLGGAEAAEPEEAALGWAHPDAGDEVEDVAPDGAVLDGGDLVVVRQAALHVHLQLPLRQLLLQRRPQLVHQPVVLLLPPPVLHVEHRRLRAQPPAAAAADAIDPAQQDPLPAASLADQPAAAGEEHPLHHV